MSLEAVNIPVNIQMVESILQLIHSLPRAERDLLEQRLLGRTSPTLHKGSP